MTTVAVIVCNIRDFQDWVRDHVNHRPDSTQFMNMRTYICDDIKYVAISEISQARGFYFDEIKYTLRAFNNLDDFETIYLVAKLQPRLKPKIKFYFGR